MGHAGRAGAQTSEQRATLWGHLLNAGQPVGTKTLTEQQAEILLDIFKPWDNDMAQQALAEALRELQGAAK